MHNGRYLGIIIVRCLVEDGSDREEKRTFGFYKMVNFDAAILAKGASHLLLRRLSGKLVF